ncbi:hypothetical protein [Vibrio sp. SCSIO 43135]|nr:hypothetical protein [Vibrio sp. SCSIO 43135]
MVRKAFENVPSHTNLIDKSVRVFEGEDALYSDEDMEEEEQ